MQCILGGGALGVGSCSLMGSDVFLQVLQQMAQTCAEEGQILVEEPSRHVQAEGQLLLKGVKLLEVSSGCARQPVLVGQNALGLSGL
eukprot:6438939-Prymnesium_polylepis.1